MRKIIVSAALAFPLCLCMLSAGAWAAETDGSIPAVFVTGNIPAEMFRLHGLPENVDEESFLAGWSYTADGKPIEQVPVQPDGTAPASRFPAYPGYHFVNVTVDNVEATQLGILQLSEFLGARGIRYYYLTHTSGRAYEISSTVLEEGQKFTINYARDEFDISYEVKMADGSALPEGVTLDSTFGAGRPVVTTNHAYSFDVRIPYGYTARVYRVWTDERGTQQRAELTGPAHPEHNGGYPLGTEPVYRKVDSTNVKVDETQGPKTMLVNDTFSDHDVTQNHQIVVELTKSAAPVFDASSWLKTEYAGGDSAQRGTTAPEDFIWEEYYSQGNHGDIPPERSGAYDWGSLRSEAKAMTRNDDGTYFYTWTFQTNSGGVGADGYVLDTLEINGQDLVVPFYPRVTDPDNDLIGSDPENGRAVGEVEGQSYTVTTLPDGARVRLDYLYVFHHKNACNQRVYRLTVTGARCNVTVSGGNLMMYGIGAPEIVTYSLVGVHADEDVFPNNRTSQHPAIQAFWGDGRGWSDHPMSNVVINFPYVGDADHGGATLRFKLADGYSNPYYCLESTREGVINGTDGQPQASIQRDETGNIISKNGVLPMPAGGTMDSRHIYGPDADGWYYIRVTGQGGFKIALLYIAATPTKYVVRYLPGEVEAPVAGTMPVFTPSADGWSGVENRAQYDDNGGSYYDIAVHNTITVDGRTPVDPAQQSTITGKNFLYWTPVGTELNADGAYKPLDESVRVYPGQALSLDAYDGKLTKLVDDAADPGYSILNPNLGQAGIDVRVLRLQAVWAPTPDKFSYTVWIEYIDEDGQRRRLPAPADAVETENDYNEGETLLIGVNLDAPVFVDWLKDHGYYHFDLDNKDVHVIDNDGEIVITFSPRNGALILEKQVSGDPDSGDVFTFTLDGPDDISENFLAWPADIPIGERAASDMIVVRFDNGHAQVQLQDGQRIVLYVPPGEYTVTEENAAGADYHVSIDGKLAADGEPARTTKTVVLQEDTGPVVFTNIFGELPDRAPKTGDETHRALWSFLLCVSGLALAVLLRKAQKRKV